MYPKAPFHKSFYYNKITFLWLFLGFNVVAQNEALHYFDLKEVRLLESPFSRAMEKDREYLLEIDADRLLAPYLKEAGLVSKKENYPNWESTGLDGHIGGHYLSALSLLYASTGEDAILAKVNYFVDELERCQKVNGNGYLSGIPNGKKIWEEIANADIKASSFGLNNRWVPLYNIHKTYSGLRDAYLYAGNEKAKQMLLSLTDWMLKEVSGLNEIQIQDMLRSEHGGLNEIFADVYAMTENKEYLTLAQKFSHKAILDPLIAGQDNLNGMHANTQIPKVIGFKRIADLSQNKQWDDASTFFWKNVTGKRSVVIGGNSVSEHFNATDDFSGMIKSIEGPETCNTYNMLKLTKQLYATSPTTDYIEYYEKALYNHILTTQHAEKGGFVYFTPMRPGHYRVYSQPETSFWCCVGSGMENHVKYGEMIYAHQGDNLYVNLFIPSKLNWKSKKIKVFQENNFPEEASTKLTIEVEKKTFFSLKLRSPKWTEKQKVKILLNGKQYKTKEDKFGYYTISRNWKKGDQVVFQLPMRLQQEQLPDGSDYYAFTYGPVLLASRYGSENQKDLFANESRGGHIANGPQIPLAEIPILLESSTSLLSHINPIKEHPLSFHLDGIYQEQFSKGFDLLPFYKIQAERYIIYWPKADAEKVEALQKQRVKKENQELKLDAITTDKVVAGEQQPEADHFIQMENSNTGYREDLHFRDAKGWFSYQMKNKTANARYLYVAYFDANAKSVMNISINGRPLITKEMKGTSGASVQYLQLPLSDVDYAKETITVKFYGQDNVPTSKIVEVRLLDTVYNLNE